MKLELVGKLLEIREQLGFFIVTDFEIRLRFGQMILKRADLVGERFILFLRNGVSKRYWFSYNFNALGLVDRLALLRAMALPIVLPGSVLYPVFTSIS